MLPMNEGNDEFVGGEIKFTAASTPEEIKVGRKLIDEKTAVKRNIDYFEKRSGYNQRELSDDEARVIMQTIDQAEKSLVDLGIPNPKNLLPTLSQMTIIEGNRGINAETGGYNNYIKYYVPKGEYPLETDFKLIVLHEISHFITPVIAKTTDHPKEDPFIEGIARGFEVTSNDPDNKRGVYEEGLADIFAQFVLNDENITLPAADEYKFYLSFMTSFLKEYANKTGITPLDAFKKVFKGKVTRDFSILKDLVGAFGTKVVRDINNIETYYAQPVDEEKIEEIAREGGFLDDYKNLYKELTEGRSITFPGIPGRFVAQTT